MPNYLNVAEGQSKLSVEDIGPYRVVVICEREISDAQRNDIARELCETGCRYMMAWGHECSLWDDAVDNANLEQFDFQAIPDSSFVMTTWHAKESLDEVFWFAKNNAIHADVELRETVLVHFGDPERESDYLCRFTEA